MTECRYCQKHCKNDNSLRNHERLCKHNPNRQYTIFSCEIFQKTNIPKKENQFTKAKKRGEVYIIPDHVRDKLSIALSNRSEETRKKAAKATSETIMKKVKEGNWHTSLAKSMHYNYKGIDLHGTWELKYAQYLDSKDIKWIRNKDRFSYIYEGKNRYYTPDFYLIETDEYIEIKGYKTDKDEHKWKQFPPEKKLLVLMKKQLKELDII